MLSFRALKLYGWVDRAPGTVPEEQQDSGPY